MRREWFKAVRIKDKPTSALFVCVCGKERKVREGAKKKN